MVIFIFSKCLAIHALFVCGEARRYSLVMVDLVIPLWNWLICFFSLISLFLWLYFLLLLC
jgi:hypothetical protein